MVYTVIRNVQAALKYRGGWKGLFEHMYTVRAASGRLRGVLLGRLDVTPVDADNFKFQLRAGDDGHGWLVKKGCEGLR
jgi:hypothetical protein